MAVTQSRVKQGKLELSTDGTAWEVFSCQPTSVLLEPSFEEDSEAVEVLCGDELSADAVMLWTLKITSIQDFDNEAGLMVFLRDHALQDVQFRFTPNATAQQVSGSVQCRPGPWYGDVGVRLTTEIEMPVNGQPVWGDQPPPL